MLSRPLQIQAVTRAAGYVVFAVAIAATANRFRQDGAGAPVRVPSTGSDPLALTLARCQSIGMAAKDDAACEAAWAENHRRFFTFRPADNAPSMRPSTSQLAAKRGGQ